MMNITGLMTEILKRWFLLGIITAIVLAKLVPSVGVKGGDLTSVVYVFSDIEAVYVVQVPYTLSTPSSTSLSR